MTIMTETVGPSSQRRRTFATSELLASVAAWMDEHAAVRPLVESVHVNGNAHGGSDVLVYVIGDMAELGIMADALGVSPERAGDVRNCHVDGVGTLNGERWWRQGSFMVTVPNGEHWSVTVTRELDAPVPTQDCGNCDGGHTGDAYCSQSTAGFLNPPQPAVNSAHGKTAPINDADKPEIPGVYSGYSTRCIGGALDSPTHKLICPACKKIREQVGE
jgi:hypothetical protein